MDGVRRELMNIFGPKRRKWQGAGKDCMMKFFVTFTLHQILLG
jgi:hypothetical protein